MFDQKHAVIELSFDIQVPRMARRLIGPRGVLSKGLNACHTVGGAQISSDTYRGAKGQYMLNQSTSCSKSTCTDMHAVCPKKHQCIWPTCS